MFDCEMALFICQNTPPALCGNRSVAEAINKLFLACSVRGAEGKPRGLARGSFLGVVLKNNPRRFNCEFGIQINNICRV